ncbi:MAG: hypothetical protein BGP07_03330 [Rhizobiales bacterium 63-22]|nr:MAG: hypothetical protein BGP07_03330 [Rhizobiales bacterium 63-22]
MATYTDQPTLAADFLYPQKVSVDVKGSAIEGGRNTAGRSQSIELSGGGLLTASYEGCRINWPAQYEYINWLGARLNGSFRFINVPIITDYYGPWGGGQNHSTWNSPDTITKWIPHSDTALFEDVSGYSQSSTYGEIAAASALNAGTITMRVYGLSRPLRLSDWFSILHGTKGWRAYRYWRVLSVIDGDAPVYTLAVSPPLREAVASGTRVEFSRPRFVAKFPSDFTLESVSESYYAIEQNISFEEAF